MELSRFRLTPSAGTYFQLADYGDVSDLPDAEMARWLTKEHGVAVIPVSAFYEDPPKARFIRFCFAKESATLTEAAERLSSSEPCAPRGKRNAQAGAGRFRSSRRVLVLRSHSLRVSVLSPAGACNAR